MTLRDHFHPKLFYDKIGFVLQEHFQGKAVINQASTDQHEKEAPLFTEPSLWVHGLTWACAIHGVPYADLDITGLRT